MPTLLQRLACTAMRSYPFPRGQGRIIDATFLSHLQFSEERLLVKCKGGFKMWVHPNDHIGRHLYLSGQFDRTIVDVVRSFCDGNERILDIGANIGYVSCALLHYFPQCRIVAVEPVYSTFSLLAQNIERVGLGRAMAINAAVSSRNGMGAMAISDSNSGTNHLLEMNGEHSAKEQQIMDVELISGDELFQRGGLDRLDIVKVDVEGHENVVIDALSTVFQTHRPRIVLFEHLGELNRSPGSILSLFDDLGYTLHGIIKHLTKWDLIPLEVMRRKGIRAHDYVAIAK